MKRNTLTLLMILSFFFATAQHPQEPVSGHYKDLQQYSLQPSAARSWMDTVRFPLDEIGSSTTFLLVKPHYLSAQQLKAISQSVKAPANSSQQTRAELDYLLKVQQQRTPEQARRVTFLGGIGYWPQLHQLPGYPSYQQNLDQLFFEGREVLGEWCNDKNFPQVSRLFQHIMLDMRVMEFTVKYEQLRPRPYHLEPALQPLERMQSPAFASGHTLWAFLQAYVWSELVPEKRDAFLALAEEIRQSREIMGIHYPSDNEAARLIAHQMVSSYFSNKQFKSDFKAASAEWEQKSPAFLKLAGM